MAFQMVGAALRAAAAAAVLGGGAAAHAFTNLDFEEATIVPDDGIWQHWDHAAPGWQHSAGSDTDRVFWTVPHLGVTQIYMLIDDSQSWSPLPVQGQYAMLFHSGQSSTEGPSQWVNAFLAQSGVVPGDARSLRLRADGEFSVTLGGTPVNMVKLGEHEYAGDVTAFAGELRTLQITHVGAPDDYTSMVVLDDIRFSVLPVPEPGGAVLAVAGLISVALARRRSPA